MFPSPHLYKTIGKKGDSTQLIIKFYEWTTNGGPTVPSEDPQGTLGTLGPTLATTDIHNQLILQSIFSESLLNIWNWLH